MSKSRDALTEREREVLVPAVLYGWDVCYDRSGYAKWEGDTTMPFRAHKTLDALVKKGLMERVCGNSVRASIYAHDYACRAPRCFRGAIYEETDGGYDREVGKCAVCNGTGLTRRPRCLATPASGGPRE